MDWAVLIKQLREKMLLTQQEFASKLDVAFASLNRWETSRFEPTMKIKRKLAPIFRKYRIEVEE